jgi:phosphatidate cytidylyltransferase
MFELKGFYTFKFILIGISLCSMILYYFNHLSVYFILVVFLFLPVIFEIFRKSEPNPVNVFLSFFGFIYITFPFMLMNTIANISGFNYLIYIIVLVWVCDTFAYFGGKYFGKNQLTTISPKKTIEGSISGFIFTIIASILFYYFSPQAFTLTDALILGAIIGIFSQVGDIFKSMLKRYCGIKDSSNIIPGHGGVLDRFDSLIFITPVIYLYINLL